MSDYTVTTEDVRERFTDWYDGPKAPPLDESRAEFDRWLAQHDAEVAKATEERIIKLLKETDLLRTIEGGSVVNYAEDAIALIKGEQE